LSAGIDNSKNDSKEEEEEEEEEVQGEMLM